MCYQVTVSRPRDDWTTSFDAGTDLQMRIDSLDPKSDYTVRVAAIRNLPNHKPIAGRDSKSFIYLSHILSPFRMLKKGLHMKFLSFTIEKKTPV